MSVTFTFNERTTCSHRCERADCDDARIYMGWCDHAEAAEAACGCRAFDVNVSNANAAAILERLDIPFDYCGQVDAADLLGRAMLGNVGRDDSGVRSVRDGNVIDCGRRVGYFDEVLGALASLATEAQRRGVTVVWS